MRVVHCKREPYTHYIGRPGPFGNPFSLRHFTRQQAIEKYEVFVRSLPYRLDMIRRLPEGAVLGCWCAPHACHGDIIVKIWKELHPEV